MHGRRTEAKIEVREHNAKVNTRRVRFGQVSSPMFSCPSSDSRESWYETTREFSVERTCIPTIDRAALPTTASRRAHAPLTPSF